jgi:hypothetical protein
MGKEIDPVPRNLIIDLFQAWDFTGSASCDRIGFEAVSPKAPYLRASFRSGRHVPVTFQQAINSMISLGHQCGDKYN